MKIRGTKIGLVAKGREQGLAYASFAIAKHLGIYDECVFLAVSHQQPHFKDDFPMDRITYYPKFGKIPKKEKNQRKAECLVNWVKTNGLDVVIGLESIYQPMKVVRPLVKTMVEYVNWEMVKDKHLKSLRLYDELWFPTNKTSELFAKYHKHRVVLTGLDWAYDIKPMRLQDKPWDGTVVFYHGCGWGGLHDRKNTPLVLSAWKKAKTKLGKARLVISAQKALGCLSKAPGGVSVSVGSVPRNEVLQNYYDAHVVVAPSKRGGCELNLYQAAKADCVTITTDSPPMNECPDGALNLYVKVDGTEPVRGSFVPLCKVSEKDLVKKMIRAAQFVRDIFRHG